MKCEKLHEKFLTFHVDVKTWRYIKSYDQYYKHLTFLLGNNDWNESMIKSSFCVNDRGGVIWELHLETPPGYKVVTGVQTDAALHASFTFILLYSLCLLTVMWDVSFVSPAAAPRRKWMFGFDTAATPKRCLAFFCAHVLLRSCQVRLPAFGSVLSFFFFHLCDLRTFSLSVPFLSVFFQSWSW